MAKKKAPETPRLADVALVGRLEERTRLAHAYGTGTLPRVMMLTGEEGIGKQRLALWLAQMILCPMSGEDGPCEGCPICGLSASLMHPDLLLYLPHASLKSGTADQLIERAEVERGELLEARRNNALYDGFDAGVSYQVAMVRLLKRDLSKKPSNTLGRRVVILPEAHLLTPREGADQSANALLKTLEEPPSGTFIILTSSVPDRVLPTIRSRTIEIPVAPLSNDDVREILSTSLPEGTDVQEAVEQSGGSVTDARRWMNDEWQTRREQAIDVLAALMEGDRSRIYDRIGAVQLRNARVELAALLNDIQKLLFQAAALSAAGEEGFPIDPRIADHPRVRRISPLAWGACLRAALRARAQAERNAAPPLILLNFARACADAFQSADVTAPAEERARTPKAASPPRSAPPPRRAVQDEVEPCPW